MTTEFITQWLQKPDIAIDEEEITTLLKAHSYFVPFRYMKASLQHRGNAFNSQMMDAVLPYKVNWQPFYNILSASVAGEKAPSTPTTAFPDKETDDDLKLTDAAHAIELKAEELPIHPEEKLEELSVQPKEKAEERESNQSVFTDAEVEEIELIQPVFTEDYFRHQGVMVEDTIPEELEQHSVSEEKKDLKSLMVVMSFAEWLQYFNKHNQKKKEDEDGKKALKTMWQKEKLATALQEENEEIPDQVFEMAVNSLAKEDGLASESLADVFMKQGKWEKAIEMYKKLSLRNPQKSAYFATQIASAQKKIHHD